MLIARRLTKTTNAPARCDIAKELNGVDRDDIAHWVEVEEDRQVRGDSS